MNKYLRVFLITGAFFGTCMGLFASLFVGIYRGMFLGLEAGGLSGLSMTIYVFLLIKIRRLTDEETQVHQIREIELRLPVNKVFEFCFKSVDLFERHKFKEIDASQGKIVARISPKSTSFDCIIQFNIRAISENRTEIKISSKSILPTALIDFGINYGIVKKIEQFLKEKEAQNNIFN